MDTLSKVIAIEKGLKSRCYSEITEMHKSNQKVDLFNGFSKVYRKKDEEGEDYPSEKKKVQLQADNQINKFAKNVTQILDITATKDYANCNAKADIIVDGKILVKEAPTTFILFLEKEINDIRTFIEALPVLDSAENWTLDPQAGLYKTDTYLSQRTKKIVKPITLAEATDKHPAQVQLVNEDIVVGYWETIKQSGSISPTEKEVYLENIEKLSAAIKCAREKANQTPTEQKLVGANIFDYLFLA